MSKTKKILIAVGLFFVLVLVEAYIFNRQTSFSHGAATSEQAFEVKSGEGVQAIGQRLEDAQLVRSKYYFDYYVWKTGGREKLQAGEYELRGSMTIPEIVQVLSIGEVVSNEVRVTFPEGTTVKQMADILHKKGFDGEEFLKNITGAEGIKTNYAFLKDKPEKTDLEGYLFPDTYIFLKGATAPNIINRMLLNFDEKLTQELRAEIESRGRSINDVVTMASILEKEVKTPEEMKIASGIFWDRLDYGMPLQSCATIAYVLGKEKKQYSYDDTRTPSPYNTYINKGLPPGPIDNPGMNALRAAIYPTKTDFNYFLTDPETGKAVFSKTIEEHEENKVKYGL